MAPPNRTSQTVSAKRTTPAERAEACHAEQIRLKAEAEQRRTATGGGRAARQAARPT